MAQETKPQTAKSKSASLQISIFDISGTKKTPVKVSKEIFGKKVGDQLLAQYVRVYLTNQRQGNANSKTRSQINLTKHKAWRQKGTGRARHGAKSAPIFVGGGVAFGPKSKTYQLKLNKKQRKSAFFGALTKAFEQNNIFGLSDSSLTVKPKTKEVSGFLKKLDIDSKKVLLVLPKLEKNNLVMASRNIPNVELADVRSLNTYTVMKQDKIVFVQNALAVLEKHYLSSNES